VLNLALFTYFIPAAFLAVPMYKTMGNYGLLNSQWALILAMGDDRGAVLHLGVEADFGQIALRAGRSGAYRWRLAAATVSALCTSLWMVPSLVAVGTYSLLLAWNEYLYAFLLLSKDTSVTLAVALGNFLSADDSPWELLMATGLIYALPPAAIYYASSAIWLGGLTAGAVKS